MSMTYDQADARPLSTLGAGEVGLLLEIEEGHELRERLLDLGWTVGTAVQCLFASPLGDPVAYGVRGSVLALRRADSRGIWVRGEART